MELRHDRSNIKHWKETPEGFLRFTAPVAKVGELRYVNADGTVRKEHVSEAVLKASADGLKIKPITTPGHPPGLIDKNTAKQYTAGSTGNTVWLDSGFLWVTGTVFDGETIAAIKSGAAKELSLGYSVKATPRADGDGYDQVERHVNHLSPVTKARAIGAEFKLDADTDSAEVWVAMDAIDAPEVVNDDAIEAAKSALKDLPNKDKGGVKTMPYKAVLDGVELEFATLDEAKHVKAVEKELAKSRLDCEKTQVEVVELRTKLDAKSAELTTAQAAIVEQKAKLDAAESRTDGATDVNLDSAKIQEIIGERMKLWQEALPFMRSDNADYQPDYALSPIEIMREVVKVSNAELSAHLDGLDLTDAGNAGFVKGLYAGLNDGQFKAKAKIRSDADSLLNYVRDRRADASSASNVSSERALEEARKKRAERIAGKTVQGGK